MKLLELIDRSAGSAVNNICKETKLEQEVKND
jgi:hypothetical protein